MKCLEPINVNKATLRNRFSMAPMTVRTHTHDGYVTDQTIAHYRRMAQGGAASIHIELTIVRPDGLPPYFRHPRASDDSFIPGMRRLAEAIRSEGAVALVQLGHFGKFSPAEIPLAVSAAVPPMTQPGKLLHEATSEEIEQVIEDHAACARRVMEAGFDGIMMHGAHGFLPQQFMSPHSNRRTDKWGRDRMLFPTELVRRVKKATRPDFIVNYRLSGDEYYHKLYPGVKGYTVDDLPEIIPPLIEAGVDSFDITAGAYDTPGYFAGPNPRDWPDGGYLPLSAAAKKVSTVPVIVTGKMNDPELIEKALAEGMCDIIGMAKQFLADPDFPKKLAEGRPEDIRHCIYCGYCGAGGGGLASMDDHAVECAINTEIGHVVEGLHTIRPTSKPRKVMVAGGGPGGMEAARVLKLRGHNVTLYEKSDCLGGQLLPAAVAPGKRDMERLTEWLTTQMTKLHVDVRLNTPVTRELVEKEKPDFLIVATGADQFKPDIPGINGRNVVMAIDVLMGRAQVGEKTVIIGGEDVGCEVGDYIMANNPSAKVTLTTLLPAFATKALASARLALAALRKQGAEFIPSVREYCEINEKGVALVDGSGAQRLVQGDTVVVAAGSRSNNALAAEVRGKGLVRYAVYTIGDAVTPNIVYDAIHSAAVAAEVI